jgi:type III pantothenate kinase
MYLTIDAGNTRTKAVVYDAAGVVLDSITAEGNELAPIKDLARRNSVEHVIVSTTGIREWKLSDLGIKGKNIELSHEVALPIRIVYTTPETLGRDRIAAACGAHALYPDKNCLVISAGTCMTMDMLLASGVYLGGNIAPGLRMRLQSMHEYTAKLPLVEPGHPDLAFGDSTVHALQNGAGLGMVMEIEGIFQRAKNAFGEVLIVMTGGDAVFLADRIESQIFVAPELVTLGLFQIIAFNVKSTY